jgi:spore coat protein H
MNKFFSSKSILCGCLAVSLLSAPLIAAATKSKNKANTAKKTVAAGKLFGGTEVLRIKIEIADADVETLKKYQWDEGGPQKKRESVKATVRDGLNVYTNVAVHLKGAAGSFRPITDNPAMTLNFDKFVDGQRFHGLAKISLNNSVQDPTFVSEQFSREMFLKSGVPTPRATQAMVELNGRDLGLYVLVEGFNKQFLKNHFKDADGNLYDGGFVKDIDQELSLNVGENPKDQSDRIALAAAAAEPNLNLRLARLQKTLDVDRFLSFMAMDVMLWDWDGYAMNKNNWRLYHDPSTGKMIFIPHGLDQMFWKPKGSILPRMNGLVAKSVLEIPELRSQYFERLKTLRATVFKTEAMTNRVQEISAKISPILKQHDPEKAKEQQKTAAEFCDAIERRGRSIDEQLATPITPVTFGSDGTVTLTRWESKSDFGHPSLVRETIDGKDVLKLGATSGSSVGTWRTKLWLEKGRYEVQGKVKANGIVPDLGDTRGGTGLRLANGGVDHYVQTTPDWTTVQNEFSVSDALGEVELLCEFRGAEGSALFDSESIKLSRLPAKK